jgi:aspartyl-tRNA(Asn)/glutamyl-tRNA(Gln) amidotransferase subunit A
MQDHFNAFVALEPNPQRSASGVLDGMTIAVKDNIDVAGLPCAAGIGALRARRPSNDASCVARLRAQGAVITGKTNMDEAALGALGDNPWFGRCENPRRRGCTPGGSSAGSAAAVAAGLCVAALGTDTLGSVRIPASYCGVVGYIPGAGLIDRRGVVPLAPSLDRVGVLSRNVADAARVASVMAARTLAPTGSPVRIGLLRGLEAFVAAPILATLEATARRLQHCHVIDAGLDCAAARRAAWLLAEVEGARVHAELLSDPSSQLSAPVRAALEFGRRAGPARIERAMKELEKTRESLSKIFCQCEVLLLPTTPQTAFPFAAPVPQTQADLTAIANIAGLAAISVPAPAHTGELPIGLQCMGARDDLVLGVAARLG